MIEDDYLRVAFGERVERISNFVDSVGSHHCIRSSIENHGDTHPTFPTYHREAKGKTL